MSLSSLTFVQRRSGHRRIAWMAAVTLVVSLVVPTATASAAPPGAALVAPGDGAVAATAQPVLSVAVSDPEGDDVEVTFEGRRKGATVPGQNPSAPFTLVTIPDVQNYTNSSRAPIIAQQAQWIVDTRAELNSQFVVQVGDLVNDWTLASQWKYVSDGLKVLDDNGMPNAVVPGNHDFDNATGGNTAYNTWFPPSRYLGAAWTPQTARYGGYLGQNQFGPDTEDRGNMNNYSLFTAGGTDWLVLGLEWEASADVLAWADRVLAAHPDRQVVMFTHAFLNLPGARRTFAQRPGGTPPETTWSTFVRTHCQIRLVLNGHEHNGDLGEARRTDDNACGQPVHQILADYQTRANGGNGWLRYYRFDPAAATMTAVTYSPYLDQYETDADSSFTLPFDLAPREPAPFIPIATVTAASGTTASATWTGPAFDTAYEWRVRVSDGTDATTSPTWTVRTPAEVGVLGRDLFERSDTNGWGTADVGGPWAVTGTLARFTVSGGKGIITSTTSTGQRANLNSVASTRTRLSTTFSVDKVAEAHYLMLIGRQVGSEQYLLRVRIGANGSATLHLMRGTSAVGAGLVLPGVSIEAGATYNVVLDVTGTSPTTLAGKLWRTGTPEPAGWQLTRTDSTAALQAPGSIGLQSQVPTAANAFPLATSFTGIQVTDPAAVAPPTNQNPVAAFTSTATGLTVSVDGSTSTDSDGTVAGWAWNFGDGTVAAGATASRTYASAGTYTVTLTVTDDDGATHAVSTPVTVTAPPAGAVLGRDLFERTVANGWGVADVGGAWTLSGTPARFSVAGGKAVITATTSTGQRANLNSISSTRTRITTSFSVDKVAEAHYLMIIGRQVGTEQYLLRVRVGANGSATLHIMRGTTAIGSGLVVPGLTITAGATYTVAFEATGTSPTGLAGKLWRTGTPEPAGWQLTRTDSTAALQAPGSIGLQSQVPTAAGAFPLATSFTEIEIAAVPTP